ncbi:MAG: hypothetical protein K9K37_04625 [Desulfocapsa sp.]|nr:hypothetical protein [Desulfocapsa sp.]
MKKKTHQLLPALCLVLAMFLWASSFIALKPAFIDYLPMVLASLAFLFLLPRFRNIRIRRQD